MEEYKLKFIIVGGLVYLCIIDFKWFCEIVDSVGVYLFVDMVYFLGLVVVGVYFNLFDYVYVVMIIMYKVLRGLCGGFILVND